MPNGTEAEMVERKLRIDRIYPENLQSHFVTNVVIQHQPDFFVLSFFEVWPPAILGETEEEKQKALDSLESVEAKCVARLIFPPDKMGEFVAAINENFANFLRLRKAVSEQKED